MKKLFIGLSLFLIGEVSLAAVSDSSLVSKLHDASTNISQYTDHETVVESIYKQLRPRANVTNTALKSTEIDKIVRSYVSEEYAPTLIANYTQLYSLLKASKKDFSTCEALQPFNLSNDVLVALCVKTLGSEVQVEYRTNGYGRGWSTAAIYVFRTEGGALRLHEIKLLLKEGTKAYVKGL